MNEISARRLGKTPNELIGSCIYDILPPDVAKLRKEKIDGVIHSGETVRFEDERQGMWFDQTIYPIFDKQGNVEKLTVFAIDITERKKTEEEIRKLNEDLKHRSIELEAINKELEAFSYSVSHDLRAPLRSIDGFSRILLEEYSDRLNTEGVNYIERVRKASQHMGQLIDDLLNLSRVARSDMYREDVNLSELAKTIASELQKTQTDRNVEFVIQKDLVVHGDARLLRIAMDNLLGNAYKFTGKNARTKIEFGATQHEGKLVYFIRDNGAGFDMTYANKLFGAFQRLHSQTEFPGTGIGLAIIQRIIHRHGGRVWAEGEVGKGATFYFTL